MLSSTIRLLSNLPLRATNVGTCKFSLQKNVSPVVKVGQSFARIRFIGISNSFSTKSMKVAILGAASKTGNCLSLFLKQSSLIDELAIYDHESTYGLALELNYIDTRCKVSTCNSSEECLNRTLENAKIVMIVKDQTPKKKSSPDDILSSNADTLSDLLPSVIKHCPRAMVAIAMNPINSLVPLAMEMYKKAGIYEYNRLFGVTTLDCVRANTFLAEVIGIEPECVMVPVIGGSCPETSIPIFSQAKPCNKLSQQETDRLTLAVRLSDEELSKVNNWKETSTIGTAFAAARFCISLCKALRHQRGVVECAYVRSCVVPQATYFAAPLELGPDGIQRHLGVPPLNDHECKLLRAAIPTLRKAIAIGETLALGNKNISTEICPQYVDPCYRALNSSRVLQSSS